MHGSLHPFIGATLTLLLTGSALHGQDPSAITLIGGASQYDLSGTGTAPFVAVRYERLVTRALVLEGGVEYLTYSPQFGDRRHHVFPEVMIQLQVPGGSLRPYVGAGAGLSFGTGAFRSLVDLTLAGAGGFRIITSSAWSMRAELRVRSVDPWTGVTADWGFGIARSF